MVEVEIRQFVILNVIIESSKGEGMLKPRGDRLLGSWLFTQPPRNTHITYLSITKREVCVYMERCGSTHFNQDLTLCAS